MVGLSHFCIGTACLYRKVPIVSMPPIRQTITSTIWQDHLHAKYNTNLCALRYNFNPHGVDDSHHDSSIPYPLAEDVFCQIHAIDVHHDDFADLTLPDSLNAFHLASVHTSNRREDNHIFFTTHDHALVDHGLQPDLHMPGDGILNLAMGYVASIGVFTAGNPTYHSHTARLNLCLDLHVLILMVGGLVG